MAVLREVVLDTETSGLEIQNGHRIIEIGCVELVNRCRTGRYFHTYVNPEREIDSTAFAVHGISTDFIKTCKLFRMIAGDLLNFIDGSTLVIHNAEFDLRFINHELAPLGLPLLEKKNVVDTLSLARKKFPGSPASLDALCRRFNISLKERGKHGALIDAELLAAVYLMMHKATQARITFCVDSNRSQNFNEKSCGKHDDICYERRYFTLTHDERQKHENMLKTIKNSIWEQKNKST